MRQERTAPQTIDVHLGTGDPSSLSRGGTELVPHQSSNAVASSSGLTARRKPCASSVATMSENSAGFGMRFRRYRSCGAFVGRLRGVEGFACPSADGSAAAAWTVGASSCSSAASLAGADTQPVWATRQASLVAHDPGCRKCQHTGSGSGTAAKKRGAYWVISCYARHAS